MASVPIYVAAITAAAGVLGAAIPQLSILLRDVRQAERDRGERRAAERRQACLDLLRAVGELRTQVANNADYNGTEMGERLAKVRKFAADAQLHAVSVALLAPVTFAEPAERLAVAANRLAEAAASDTDLKFGSTVRRPNFSELDKCVVAFRRIAVGRTEITRDALPGS
jgi:hypothetical protein